jgi:hypothetical protein
MNSNSVNGKLLANRIFLLKELARYDDFMAFKKPFCLKVFVFMGGGILQH